MKTGVAMSALLLMCALLTGMAPLGHATPGDLDMSFGGLSQSSLGAERDVSRDRAGREDRARRDLRRRHHRLPAPVQRRSRTTASEATARSASLTRTVQWRRSSVAVQADGKIVVAGQGNYDGFTDFLVVRLTTSGSLDLGFSGNGFASAWVSTFENDAQKVLIQPDGKIVVVGSALLGGDYDFAAARFNPDGTLDASFSGDGMASVGGFATFGAHDKCYDAVLQANGKLVMVGGSVGFVMLDEDFAVARLNIDGSLDESFDGDGRLKTGFGDFYDRAYAVAIQPSDLRIVVVGQGSDLGSEGRAARYYSSDGSLDNSFDGDGKMNLPFIAYDAAVNTAGKIALTGSTPMPTRMPCA